MYAVMRTGGKQYRVAAGDILEVEKLDVAVGDTVTLDDVSACGRRRHRVPLVNRPLKVPLSPPRSPASTRTEKSASSDIAPRSEFACAGDIARQKTRLEIQSISA